MFKKLAANYHRPSKWKCLWLVIGLIDLVLVLFQLLRGEAFNFERFMMLSGGIIFTLDFIFAAFKILPD